MNNYLLNHEKCEEIWEKLVQIKAIAGLINQVTSPDSNDRNDNVNTVAWLISEQISSILTDLENLPAQGNKHE